MGGAALWAVNVALTPNSPATSAPPRCGPLSYKRVSPLVTPAPQPPSHTDQQGRPVQAALFYPLRLSPFFFT